MSMTMSNRTRVYWIASILFLLSGCTGLVYEVIWFKRFSHVWGSSTLAMASVVGSFLFGLGLGAHLLGRVADRVRYPLLWYGVCEVGIGVLAVVIPFEIQWLTRIAAPLYPVFQGHALAYYLVRSGLTFLIIGPPCVLMGGTLPLLVKQFTPPGSALRQATGWLYAINTLGAAAGCYLAGFHLLPAIGLYWANLVVAGVNLAVGIAAIATTRLLAAVGEAEAAAVPADDNPTLPAPDKPEAADDTERPEPYPGISFYLAVGIAGFAALVLQMVWARQLALILGGSTYAFSAMLFVILVGIGLGSLIFRLWAGRLSSLRVTLTVLILVMLLGTLAGQWLILYLTYAAGIFKNLRTFPLVNGLICVTASTLLELVPALGMGFMFPLFVHMTRKMARDAGKAVGNVYAWNTVGTIVGATVTSSLIIPRWGSSAAVALAAGFYIAVLLSLFPSRRRRDDLVRLFLFILACPVLLGTARWSYDPVITNAGMYLDGYEAPDRLRANRKQLSFEEGSACSVLVTEEGGENIALRVNGKTDASDVETDMLTQLGSAYLPRFLYPQAQNVLVIGYGSGVTAGASLLFPGTTVKCCEIERAVINASKFFAHVNHRPQDYSAFFSVILEDGRSYLQGTEEEFDLIISEPSNPWMAGTANLFTKEYYQAAKEHLNTEGILVQWIQLYSFTSAEYAMVVNTVRSVFAHYGLIRVSDGDTIMLASSCPLDISKQTVETAQALVEAQPEVRSDLRKHFGSADVASLLLEYFMLGQESLDRLVENEGSVAINTDLNMRLEFDAPLHMFRPHLRKDALNRSLLETADFQWTVAAFRRWECSKEHLPVIARLVGKYIRYGQFATAVQLTDLALELNPEHAWFMAEKLQLAPPQNPEAFREAVAKLAGLHVQEASRVGVAMFRAKRFDKAVEVFEVIRSLQENSATVWNNLAICYQALGQWDKADEAYRKALNLDPANETVMKTYNAFKIKRATTAPGL